MLKDKQPRYPIYVISKGRWDSRLTVKALEKIGIKFFVVIEPQEYENYAAVIDENKLLVLPFSNLGNGSIPARNWVWEDSIKRGYKRHWILDDNLAWFAYISNNKKTKVKDSVCFRFIEDFTDKYENIGMSGMQYEMFTPSNANRRPFIFNTRVYSCILLNNEINHRWRGRYNEDTDLSIRILKDGWCTILSNIFVCKKMRTMTMKGGNTDLLYKDDGRYQMALSLKRQHPEILKIKRKFGRWQHSVDYRPFRKNKLIRKEGYKMPKYKLKLLSEL